MKRFLFDWCILAPVYITVISGAIAWVVVSDRATQLKRRIVK